VPVPKDEDDLAAQVAGWEVIAALVVPVRAGETIGPGPLSEIFRDVEMDVSEFETWL
jgi:hypothetical protein